MYIAEPSTDMRVHVARNSSEVLSGITHKVDEVVFGVLVPLLTIFSSIVLLVMITFALIAIDPIVASVAAVGLVLVTFLLHGYLKDCVIIAS